MASLIKKRIKGQAAKIPAWRAKLAADGINALNESTKRHREASEVLEVLDKLLPLDLGYIDLIGDIDIELPKRAARKVLKRLIDAGFGFDEAGYSLSLEKDKDGRDQVWVQRRCNVAPVGCPGAKGRLVLQWLALYKGGSKCKIVESTFTSRGLVCTKD